MTFYVFELKTYQKDVWQRILQIAFLESDTVIFTKNNPKSKVSLYPRITDFVVTEFQSDYRWFNKQLGSSSFIKVVLNQLVKGVIMDIEYLDDWIECDLEDPAFFNKNRLLIWTINHEKLIFIEKVFFDSKVGKIDGLSVSNECIYDISDSDFIEKY